MAKTNKELISKLNKLLFDVTISLDSDVRKLMVTDEQNTLANKRSLVNILCKLANSITKLNQLQHDSMPRVTNNLTIEDNRIITNYLKKSSINE